jgi:superfamily II helicase
MSTFEISDKNVIMASFDDVLEEVRKAFEEHKKAREKEMQELFACYTKDCCGSITQIKELILPLIDSTKEVHIAKVLHSSTSVTPDDVSAMFSEHVKFTRNMVGEEIAKGLTRFSQNSKYQPTTVATTHPAEPRSSATPSTSATPLP